MTQNARERVDVPGGGHRPCTAPALGLAVLTLMVLTAAGCQRDRVAHYRVPKVEPVPAAATSPGPSGGAELRWTLPAGWKEGQGDGKFRYATFAPPGKARLEVYVVRLPGPAGGELANVNRWRNQLGLAPLAEGDLAAARQRLKSGAGELAVYDFSSEGAAQRSRTIAGLTAAAGETWFVKMTGDPEAVAASRPAFLELLGSLRLDAR